MQDRGHAALRVLRIGLVEIALGQERYRQTPVRGCKGRAAAPAPRANHDEVEPVPGEPAPVETRDESIQTQPIGRFQARVVSLHEVFCPPKSAF